MQIATDIAGTMGEIELAPVQMEVGVDELMKNLRQEYIAYLASGRASPLNNAIWNEPEHPYALRREFGTFPIRSFTGPFFTKWDMRFKTQAELNREEWDRYQKNPLQMAPPHFMMSGFGGSGGLSESNRIDVDYSEVWLIEFNTVEDLVRSGRNVIKRFGNPVEQQEKHYVFGKQFSWFGRLTKVYRAAEKSLLNHFRKHIGGVPGQHQTIRIGAV